MVGEEKKPIHPKQNEIKKYTCMIDQPSFRPWGLLCDILNGEPKKTWDFLSCVSMEDRSLAAYSLIRETQELGNSIIFDIEDNDSRFKERVDNATATNKKLLINMGCVSDSFSHHYISGRTSVYIDKIDSFFNDCDADNLVIDITSLPKKYFFIILKKALENYDEHKNIIVTYTQPAKYGGVKLAENHEGWNALPGFQGPVKEPKEKKLIIGLGFEPLGLPAMYGKGLFNKSDKHFLFPFPAQPESIARNWEFLRQLQPNPSGPLQNLLMVDGLNVPMIFDKLNQITDTGASFSILAPFGPKPMSLAMCLFACSHANKEAAPSVFYTQPTVYNPNYSVGVGSTASKPCIYAYAIRLNGKNLY